MTDLIDKVIAEQEIEERAIHALTNPVSRHFNAVVTLALIAEDLMTGTPDRWSYDRLSLLREIAWNDIKRQRHHQYLAGGAAEDGDDEWARTEMADDHEDEHVAYPELVLYPFEGVNGHLTSRDDLKKVREYIDDAWNEIDRYIDEHRDSIKRAIRNLHKAVQAQRDKAN